MSILPYNTEKSESVEVTSLYAKKPRPYVAQSLDTSTINVEHYAKIVRKIASILIARLPASVEFEDLVQVGIIGLIEAIKQFDPSQGTQFETFASQRIRGAMLDELRRIDWLPRQLRKNAKLIEEAIAKLEQTLGRPPQEAEIAQELKLSLADYQLMLSECKGHTLVYFEDFLDETSTTFSESAANIADPCVADPFGVLEDSAFRNALINAIKNLPERDQLIMSLYYEEELNLKEIGAILGVSESRVCQLHSQAVNRLRVSLSEWV